MSYRINRTGFEVDSLLQKGYNGYTATDGLKFGLNSRNVPILQLDKTWIEKEVYKILNIVSIPVIDFELLTTNFNIYGISTIESIKIGSVTPENATDQSVTYTSSKPSVASVTSKGVIKSVGYGTTEISVKMGNVTKTCRVSVSEKNVEVSKVEVAPKTVAMLPGQTYQLYATVYPNNATDKTVTWTSSNPQDVSVSNTGLVKVSSTFNSGNVVISASSGNFSGSCTIVVSRPEVRVESIMLPNSIEMRTGEQSTVTATVTPTDFYEELVWTSQNPSMVSVVKSEGASVTLKVTDTISSTTRWCMLEVTSKNSKKTAQTPIKILSTVYSASNSVYGMNFEQEENIIEEPKNETLIGEVSYVTSTPVNDVQEALENGVCSFTNSLEFMANGNVNTYIVALIPDTDEYVDYSAKWVDGFGNLCDWDDTSDKNALYGASLKNTKVLYNGIPYRIYAMYNGPHNIAAYSTKIKIDKF